MCLILYSVAVLRVINLKSKVQNPKNKFTCNKAYSPTLGRCCIFCEERPLSLLCFAVVVFFCIFLLFSAFVCVFRGEVCCYFVFYFCFLHFVVIAVDSFGCCCLFFKSRKYDRDRSFMKYIIRSFHASGCL